MPFEPAIERPGLNGQLLHETVSLCRTCKNGLPAQVLALPGGEVWMHKRCPQHGEQQVRLSTNASWYEQTRARSPVPRRPRRVVRQLEHGCPFDCGACELHEQRVRLPVVTITSACNLDCPICYVHNKNEAPFHMEPEEFRRVLAHLSADGDGDVDIVNLTGGEPTLHPHVLEMLELAQQAGVHRVTLCSNGVRLARDEPFVKRLAELGTRIALSFDSFDPEADYALQGAHLISLKLRALELLEKHGVDTTLIPVMTKGVNDHEIGRMVDLTLRMKCIRHLEVHTITYTGQGGTTFPRAGRISMFEVLEQIEKTTGGLLRPDDFVPSPHAHPLCYQIAYLLLDPQGGPPIPFTRFLAPEQVQACLTDHLYLEPSRQLEDAFREAIDRLWTEGGAGCERTLQVLGRVLKEMFPQGRKLSRAEALAIGERTSKAIYIHSHMDEETWDNERIAQCCDSNCYADGTTIPVCSYNVLYREKEPRFMAQPRAWNERSGGQRRFPVKLPVLTR